MSADFPPQTSAREPNTQNAKVQFYIDPQSILSLSFKVAIYTILTLGLYRFWGKTQIRRALWSSTELDGDRFEYTGTGLEKFLGFLIAIVVLAIYLGLFQLILTFAGLGALDTFGDVNNPMAELLTIYLSLLAVLPLIFYATYRARRYQLARTRWRGIRFGMEQGAWGFAFRAVGYFLLNVVTIGIFSPLMRFRLEKYMTDRSYFGNTRLTQHGKWTELYRAMRQLFIAFLLFIVGAVLFAVQASTDGSIALAVIGGLALGIGYIWFFVGLVSYQVRSSFYLITRKEIGEGTLLFSRLNPQELEALQTRMVRRLIWGNIGAFMVGGIAMGLLAGLGVAIGAATDNEVLIVALPILGYLLGFAFVEALIMIWATVPYVGLILNNLTISDVTALERIEQRAAESRLDAEGFADALDVGGAI